MSRSRPLTRLSALLLGIACVAAVVAAPVDAAVDVARRHTRLLRSIPARDSIIAAPPPRLQLWFNEPIELSVSRVRLAGPGPRGIPLGPLERAAADAPVTAPLPADLADGRWVVHWSTASKDGHVVRDSFAFTLRHP